MAAASPVFPKGNGRSPPNNALMRPDWRHLLDRWQAAGLIDSETSQRIGAWETREARPARFEWPVLLALILGGIALGAGLLLFVAANWDRLSPGTRFSLVLCLVGIFHFTGAISSRDSPAFQSALHAIGTVALGAGIALAGQIFQLPLNWPGGTFLWGLGAFLAWLLLRDTAQLALTSVLIPIWLGAEFIAHWPTEWPQLWGGALLLALVYTSSLSTEVHSHARMALVWIGSITLLPFTAAAGLRGVGHLQLWILLLPLALAWFVRGREVWIPALFAGWIVALQALANGGSFLLHLWCALGSIGLIAWGWRDGRKERINLGVAGFALNILLFYVSSVLDKLGRSASLITLGILLLAGGWVLERIRRRLVKAV